MSPFAFMLVDYPFPVTLVDPTTAVWTVVVDGTPFPVTSVVQTGSMEITLYLTNNLPSGATVQVSVSPSPVVIRRVSDNAPQTAQTDTTTV